MINPLHGVTAAALLTIAATVAAQCPSSGGNTHLTCSAQASGATVIYTLTGAGNAPFYLFYSSSIAPVSIPGVGTICLDYTALLFMELLNGQLDASGSFALPLAVPSTLNGFLGFAQNIVLDATAASGLRFSEGLRIEFETLDSFEVLPNMGGARALPTAALLNSGRVLVAGGVAGALGSQTSNVSTELFDPVTRTFGAGPPLLQARGFHCMTTLDDGRVLITGGATHLGTVLSHCEIYDPATNSMSVAASLNTPRASHTATLLQGGRVLVAGGTTSYSQSALVPGPTAAGALATAEVYDPVTNTWSATLNNMAVPRESMSAERINNGKVLVIGGATSEFSIFGIVLPVMTATTSLYDPALNTFTAGPSLGSGYARCAFGSTLLSNGGILVAGGLQEGLIPSASSGTRVWTPGATAFVAGPTMASAVIAPRVELLSNSKVHIVGGVTGNFQAGTFSSTAGCATYAAGTLTSGTALPAARGALAGITLLNGATLYIGGGDVNGIATSSAYLYTPGL